MSKIFILLFLSTSIYANQFPMGVDDGKSGTKVTDKDAAFQLKLGTRFQAILEVKDQQDKVSGESESFQDIYGRRVRLEVAAKYKNNMSYKMDLRNDKVNQSDAGEGDFNVGDAYMEVKNLIGKGDHDLKFRMFRAKVDVSRSETAGSATVMYLLRAHSADEAAQFVSDNRRAMNMQLVGNYKYKISYQFVIGDGVESGHTKDVTGDSADAITKQNLMIGGKLRFSPFSGWEDKKITETYFGKGKHFSLGFGYFNTSNINFEMATGETGELDHKLTNVEASFHYRNFNIIAEYFEFDGVAKDFDAAELETGKSSAYYVAAEYVLPSMKYIAPFYRYEVWDRFKTQDNYEIVSNVYGLNWYLLGNKARVGLFYQVDEFEDNILSGGNDEIAYYRLTTMFHF